jgi:tRNA-splicing ligase RtcB
VSEKAISRGINQLGTLGSGNHYLEIQLVTTENIFDEKIAKVFGIKENDQIVIMVHCGSRGFGHQVATDYLRVFDKAMKKYGMTVRDRELACAPFKSPEGSDYYKAMLCAANSAFANRQIITHRIRESFSKVFDTKAEKLGIEIVYDVAHNIARVERYEIDGKEKEVLVHRKGSTRSFGPGRRELPEIYRETGQPVIVGGSMQTGSFLLTGTEKAMEETFGSTMHGAGRTMSRSAAKKLVRGDQLMRTMAENGILVKAASMPGLAEEAGIAYKDISEVVETMDILGISKKVVKLKPIGNIKG